VNEEVTSRALLYGVRPEHVQLSDHSKFRGEVIGVEYLGNCQVLTINTQAGCTVRAKVGTDIDTQRGEKVGLAFDATEITLFDEKSGRAIRTARDERPMSLAGTRGASHGRS
jgi:multiple sugar transport system ATP-binding protein